MDVLLLTEASVIKITDIYSISVFFLPSQKSPTVFYGSIEINSNGNITSVPIGKLYGMSNLKECYEYFKKIEREQLKYSESEFEQDLYARSAVGNYLNFRDHAINKVLI